MTRLITSLKDLKDYRELIINSAPSLMILLYPYFQGLKDYNECYPEDNKELLNIITWLEGSVPKEISESQLKSIIRSKMLYQEHCIKDILMDGFYVYIVDGEWHPRLPSQSLGILGFKHN